MKAILAVIVGLMFVGTAFAQLDVDDFEHLAYMNLYDRTPGFASGWAEVWAHADWEPAVDYDTFGKLAPYTTAQIVFTDPTGAANMVVDPTANLNMTVVAMSGLGVDSVTQGAISDKTQEWQSYASSAGMAVTDISAIHNAWTIAQFDVDAEVDPFESTSEVEGIGIGIADSSLEFFHHH